MRYIIFMTGLLCSFTGFGQSPCFCNITLESNGDCCADLIYSFSPSCGAQQAYSDQIVVDLTVSSGNTGKFVGITQSDPVLWSNLSAVFNASNDVLTINYLNPTTSANLGTLGQIGSTINLGKVCFEESAPFSIAAGLSMGAMGTGGPNFCNDIVETGGSCPEPGEWKKLYGTDEEETVNKVKAFGDGVYVAGKKTIDGDVFATFTKFDITDGRLVWERFLEEESEFRDFDYNPATDEFIVVGRTLPFITGGVVQDNQFIMSKWTPAGGLSDIRVYDHNGREGFEQQIVVHKNPVDPDAAVYVVLARSAAPLGMLNSRDITIAYNFRNDLGVKWVREYPNVTGTELETHRGLEDLSDGNILLLGNGLANAGTVLRINGIDGSFISPGYYHQGVIDWYDAVELPNGNVVLSGTDFASDQALMMIVDPVSMNAFSGITFPGANNFQEAWYNPGENAIYSVAREKAGNQHNVVFKLDLDATLTSLTFNWAKYLEEGETDYKDPHVFVSNEFDRLFYADSRKDHPRGFGDYDLLVGSMDLEMEDCECIEDFGITSINYNVATTNVFVDDIPLTKLPYDEVPALESSGECISFCPSSDTCTTDFTWTANCGIIQLDAATPSGTGPFTYEWDIGCDDPAMPERTGQSTTWTVNNGGVYNVCLKVTDTATGCVATSEQQIFVELGIPVITCPPSIIISTDPGLCTATHQLVEPTVTDDCTTMFNITCTMSGATTGPAVSPVTLNTGVTDISCFTVDGNNQGTDCEYSITVVDNEAPVITCALPISVTVPGCEGGAFPFIEDPVVTDNCEGVEWTTDHSLGDFFACGTRTVTFTATDGAGNQSTCNVPVTVNCECAEVENPIVECTDVDDQLFFSVNVRDLAAADTGCTFTVTSPQTGITISNPVVSGTGPNYLVSGLIDMTAPPVPTGITIIVTVECVCFDRSEVTCSIPVNLPVPCCKEISVEPQEVCKTGGPVQIPLLGCNNLYDIQQVRWFVADAPCMPTTDFGEAFQVTTGCAPLTLAPEFHNNDVCVYAEVTMGADAGACTVLMSDTVTIILCKPLDCYLNPETIFYCWSGTPIIPEELFITLATDECRDSIRWFDPQGNPIPSANDQFSYQPPALDFTLPTTECVQSYTYRVEVSNQCGTQSCSATIRLDNKDAPVGILSLLAPDVNPLCHSEDAVLEYIPECAGNPERWDWFIRPDAVPTYTPLTTNGDRNPNYYSNRLYEDTWVMVEKTNGSCPADSIELFLDVIDPVAVTSFTAAYNDPCAPSFVDLRFGFSPNPATPGSSYTVTWYRNGQVIQINNVTSGGDAINYNGLPPLFSLAGNYYATVENSLCPGLVRSPVITLDPPMEVYALGPCFRCKTETITLGSLVLNPINGFTCTYQWYDNGTPIIGETGPNLTVDPYWSGPFTFEVTCTNSFITCVQSDVYDLLQCGPVDRCMPAAEFAEFAERSIDIDRSEEQVIINAVGLTRNFNLSVDFEDASEERSYTVDELPIIYTYQSAVTVDPTVTLFEYDDAGLECNSFTTATADPAAAAIGLKLYPNPNAGQFMLDFNLPQAGDFTIAVFDLTGRKMLTEQHWIDAGQQQLPLKVSQLPPGTYVLRMVGSGFTAAAKFQRVR